METEIRELTDMELDEVSGGYHRPHSDNAASTVTEVFNHGADSFQKFNPTATHFNDHNQFF